MTIRQSETSPTQGISVVIPCLNEGTTISTVIADARHAVESMGLPSEIIVVDNGSTDDTARRARGAGATVIEAPTRGYGVALDLGFQFAHFEWIVFADGDLSYPFDSLPRLVAPLVSNEADLVLGSRLRGFIESGAMPLMHRWLGTPLLSALCRIIHRIPTTDITSGMRAVRKQSYLELGMTRRGMDFGAEMLVRGSRRRLRYREVPIRYLRDQRNRGSHLRTYRDGVRFLWTILALR